jgi:DNA repair ATPase RecN
LFVNKPEELRRIYKEDCMKYLTFLDYPTFEATSRSFEAQLKQKDKEIEELRRRIEELTVSNSEIDKFRQKVDEHEKLKIEVNNLYKLVSTLADRKDTKRSD